MTAEAPAATLWRVETTVATHEQARALARRLIAGRFAACAQIEAIESVYRWQGEVQVEPECRLVLKTTAARYPALEAEIRAHHPYELPEIAATTVTACNTAYARWVADCVADVGAG